MTRTVGSLPPLAVLDWGIGGFGFVAELQKRHPEAAFTYLSDSGTTPYGKMTTRALTVRVQAIADFFSQRGVRALAIACYSGSTVVPYLKPVRGLQLFDILTVARAETLRQKKASWGIVGGRRTIRSQLLAAPLRRAGTSVIQRVAQPLSGHIERGDLNSPALLNTLDKIVAPLRQVDRLLLACTHYPAIASHFSERLPGTTIVDPIAGMVSQLDTRATSAMATGSARFFTTGSTTKTQFAAKAAFGVHANVEALTI